ncbi:MAG: polymer-forming cytoskeletal protein [Flavobacteriaceae bacterium]|jgi:cytoskeletal protein CcmA (bactofilin family)|nr:polymer-forming cytoskeletal protein [Flavobacteriaceae bacterium]
MFSEKKTMPGQVLERNIIGKNSSFKGDIISEGDFRIDGKVEGTVKTSGRVVIGQDGHVEGTINCSNADVEGSFSGNLNVEELLSLKSTATISGEVILGKLSVEPGANFNASCTMKGSIKSLKNEQPKKEKTA